MSAETQHKGVYSRSFSPYQNNGGTTLAIPGNDFVIVAGDTRLSLGYSIQTRQSTKLCKLTDHCILATAGMQADASTLHKTLKAKLTWYEHQHGKQISTPAVAQMLSNTLYYRRFFPYYTFNLVAGLDQEGKGAVYGYDAIGSYERLDAGSQGTGQSLIQPLLDNQISQKNHELIANRKLTLQETLSIVKDAFTGAGERDIYTGDSVEIAIITKEGIQWETLNLKKD